MSEFEHYGVKGMRWGVRKKSRYSAKERSQIDRRKKDIKRTRSMSDAHIDAYIARLEKERKLKSLLRDDTSPGHEFVDQILTSSGKKIAKNAVLGVGTVALGSAVEAKFGADIARRVAPNPHKK